MRGSRRQARTIALQTLYELDVVNHALDTIIARYREESEHAEEVISFATYLIRGVLENKERIDSVIRRFATLWPVEQISVVDRNILRVAIFEILIDNRTPFKVSINEAVELAKNFGSENSARFINGVLGSMVRERDICFRKEASNSGNRL